MSNGDEFDGDQDGERDASDRSGRHHKEESEGGPQREDPPLARMGFMAIMNKHGERRSTLVLFAGLASIVCLPLAVLTAVGYLLLVALPLWLGIPVTAVGAVVVAILSIVMRRRMVARRAREAIEDELAAHRAQRSADGGHSEGTVWVSSERTAQLPDAEPEAQDDGDDDARKDEPQL